METATVPSTQNEVDAERAIEKAAASTDTQVEVEEGAAAGKVIIEKPAEEADGERAAAATDI